MSLRPLEVIRHFRISSRTLIWYVHSTDRSLLHKLTVSQLNHLFQVVGFFSSRLVRVQDQRGELGVNEVLEVISKGASQWSSDRLRVRRFVNMSYI